MPLPLTFPALGTTAALFVTDPGVIEIAHSILNAEIAAIDAACSRFRDDSELSVVNANGGHPTRVSAGFLEALDTALRAARLTNGRVDPTVGSALRVLGYDRDFDGVDRHGPPLRGDVQRVRGWRTIEVDRPESTVRVPKGVELDFGATAKALCADRATRAIALETGVGALVSLGGDIAVGGTPPQPGWDVFVTDNHVPALDAPGQRVLLRTGGLATSGTSVRRWQRGAEELHHVIDPESGGPAREHWRTASVAAASCVDANIASTAAIVMGTDAPAWLEVRGLPARLVATDGSVVRVAGWPVAERAVC
jgi:FAD:protein FMN transferase